jgi:hypothetical protein
MTRLIPVIGFLIALGLFFGYINPTVTGPIAAIRLEIAEYDRALEAAARFKEKEAELAADRAAIPPESLVRLEAFLPDGVDNVQLILDLDALASRTGLVLDDFQTTEAQQNAPAEATSGIVVPTDAPIDSIELSATGTGTYEAFRTFLSASEISLRPLDLTNLELKTSQNGVYTYGMTFRLYWLR